MTLSGGTIAGANDFGFESNAAQLLYNIGAMKADENAIINDLKKTTKAIARILYDVRVPSAKAGDD